MRVKECKTCGFPLHRKPSKCHRCKTPVKKITARHYSILTLMVFIVGFLFTIPFSKFNFTAIFTSPKSIQSKAAKTVEERHPIQNMEEIFAKVYVKGKVVNIRQNPSLKSPTLGKITKGHQLHQTARSGEWIQVQAEHIKGKQGWIHVSLVSKSKPDQPIKAITPHQAFNALLKYFEQLNTEIKKLKGMTFFENAEYLDNGIIQITATNIFLSAPEIYKKKYVGKIMQKWATLRRPDLPAVVRIIDAEGILRMKKKRD